MESSQPGKQVPRRDQKSGYHYRLYTPPAHNSGGTSKKWPLLLFLHGAGESGRDLNNMISEGATGCPPVELANGRADPALADHFIVASPQTWTGWSDASQIASFVQSLIGSSELAVDSSRVYCTGVSMGGGGTWAAGTTGVFAAIAPVCGTQRIDPAALDGVAVWAFHGANDVVVPVGVTDGNVEKLREHRADAADTIKYTRYETSPAPIGWASYDGHASWMQAYKGGELWSWFLTRTKE